VRPAGATSPAEPVPPAGAAFAGEHPVEFYVQAALQRNPGIRAAERRVAAAADEVPQVTALPDPMVENTFWPISANSPQTASGRMANSLTVSQRFPWFGKLQLRGQLAQREAQIALTELAEAELQVAEEVKTAYYEIAFYLEATRVTRENERFLEQYIALAESLYKVGRASQQDILRAQVERDRLRDQLIELGRQTRTAQADLARLLSVPPETDLRPAQEPVRFSVPEQVDQLYRLAIASRPELRGRLEAIARDRDRVDLARLEYYPDVNLGVNWSLMTTGQALAFTADGKDNIGFGVGFNLPIRREKLQAGVRQATARVAESSWRYEAARDDTLRSVRRLTVQARALEQQIELFRKNIIPRAEQTLKTSEADYRVGKVDALTVLTNFTELLRFRVQLARLESMLGQTLASLERAVGVELARPEQPKGKELPPPRELPK
jgi:outer membrane protein TolC